MSEKLMSDERHEHLLKSAEETVGLMNIGIDPNAALAKVAEDKNLNDHEVDVVAHAVNNSKQLAYLQNNDGDDREGEFPLIDPENVRAYGDNQPATNADANTGDRYGSQECPGDNIEAKMDAPDAPEIHEELLKESNALCEDYRLRPEAVDYGAVLREGWALGGVHKVAEYVDPNPFSHLTRYNVGIGEADMRYTAKTAETTDTMQEVADYMRRIDAPEWALVEKTAAALDASKPILDMVYAMSGIEKFGAARHDWSVKTAGQLKVSRTVLDLAEKCAHADTCWQEAADIHAAGQILREQLKVAEEDLFPKEEKLAALNPGELADPIEKAPEEFGISSDTVQSAIGGVGEKPETEAKPFKPSQAIRQELENVNARGQLEGLMEDEYVSGHSLPEVIDAYNAAMSVNPEFGNAELVSYVRQHLATQGAVPLDLQIRARPQKTPLIGKEV
jgi:hypothetical protein